MDEEKSIEQMFKDRKKKRDELCFKGMKLGYAYAICDMVDYLTDVNNDVFTNFSLPCIEYMKRKKEEYKSIKDFTNK